MDKENKSYQIAGLMSGTSLDGLDICLVSFESIEKQWNFQIVSAKTIKYSTVWKEKLESAKDLSGRDLAILDRELGKYFGQELKAHLDSEGFLPDLVASHGHTIFHQIDQQLSLQIGHGAFLTAACGYPVVSDFRSLDTAYGGEGAPLVPVAEKHLFPAFSTFLNIGGIANLSVHQKRQSVIGFDICPANQVLNYLSQRYFNKEYDQGGEIARKGKLDPSLLSELDALEYYQKKNARSLGREYVEEVIYPILEAYKLAPEDLMNTFCHHIANQISNSIKTYSSKNTLLTGGGAYHSYLVELIKKGGVNVQIPKAELVEFKEALSFAFLGLLRYLEKPNVASSVTASKKDNCGGSIFIP